MRGKMCKRFLVISMAFLLGMESVTPAFAAQTGELINPDGIVSEAQPCGMQPFDISEESIASSQITEEEFMARHGLDEADLEAAEAEAEEALGLVGTQSEEVAAEKMVSANSADVTADKAVTYATLEDAADYLRDRMVARKEDVTLRVAGSKDTALKNVTKIFEKVYEYDINGEPDEGDYLYWHMKYMEWTKPSKNSDGTYTIHMWLYYRTTAAEEKYVTKKVNNIVKNLNLKSSSLNDYQKVRAIYDYIMSIIEYDYYHYETDQSYNYMYTTYEALNSGFAVCQAYATLFYRLCEEAGISARVICGNDDSSGNPTHGWNIVKIGKYYYNLDATWDDADTPTHIYFLKNMEDFTDHQRNAVNAGTAFDKEFPTSPVSYPTPEADVTNSMVDLENIDGTLALIDGSSYSLAADGRTKAIFFVDPTYCAVSWLEGFYESDYIKSSSCDALVVDIYDGYADYGEDVPGQVMDKLISYAQSPAKYSFSSDYTNGLAYKEMYASMTGKASGCYCSVAVIDASNRLRYFNYADEAVAELDKVMLELSYSSAYGTISGLSVTQTKNNAVKLSWNAYSGATGYQVYRKMGSGAYCCVATTTGTTLVDEITPKYTYKYQVRAIYESKEIASSAEKSIATKQMLLTKGKTYTVDGYKYKVLKSTNSSKTVAFAGVSNKKLTKVLIPDTVVINGLKYKVTEISAKALKGNKKVKTVSIGTNVTKIGKQAFYKATKLANIVVKTKKLKSVGKNALYGISKKAEIRVPSSKLSKYKKLFKGKGQKSSVQIKK